MIINRAKERKFVLRITYIKKKEKFNTQFPSVISIEIYFHKYTLYNFILSLPLPPPLFSWNYIHHASITASLQVLISKESFFLVRNLLGMTDKMTDKLFGTAGPEAMASRKSNESRLNLYLRSRIVPLWGKREAGRKFLQADIEVKDFPAVCRAKIKLERVHLPPRSIEKNETLVEDEIETIAGDPVSQRSPLSRQNATTIVHFPPFFSRWPTCSITPPLHFLSFSLFFFSSLLSTANHENERERESAGKVDRIDERCPNANKITSGRQWARRPPSPLMMTEVMKRSRLSLSLR